MTKLILFICDGCDKEYENGNDFPLNWEKTIIHYKNKPHQYIFCEKCFNYFIEISDPTKWRRGD